MKKSHSYLSPVILLLMAFSLSSCTLGGHKVLRVSGQFPANSQDAKDEISISNSINGFCCNSKLEYLNIVLELDDAVEINDIPIIVLRGTDRRETIQIPLLPQGKRKSYLNDDDLKKITAFSFYGPVLLHLKKNDYIKIEIRRSDKSNNYPILYDIIGNYTESFCIWNP